RAAMLPRLVRSIGILAGALCLFSPGVRAQSTLIPIGAVQNLIFDHSGQHLYITNWQYNGATQGFARSYNVSTGQLEATYNVPTGGGIGDQVEIAADDSFLLISGAVANGQLFLYKLDLSTGTFSTIKYPVSDPNAW